jgi:hypothetical protein
MATTEKTDGVEQLEHGKEVRGAAGRGGVSVHGDGEVVDADMDVHDEKANQRLNRQLDKRIIPLCCWVNLMNFLDRGIFSLPLSSSQRSLFLFVHLDVSVRPSVAQRQSRQS